MENEEIIEKLLKIYEEKISKGLNVTEEEREFIRKNLRLLNKVNTLDKEIRRNYFLHCAFSDEFGITGIPQMNFVVWSRDDKAILDFIQSKSWKISPLCYMLFAIRDKSIVEKYLERVGEPLSTRLIDGHCRIYCRNENSKKAWNENIVRIKDVSELSVEDISKLPDDIKIRICGENVSSWQKELYTKELYIKILNELNKMLEDIPAATKGNTKSELKTFLGVCAKLSVISYDEEAEEEQKKDELIGNPNTEIEMQNLEGAVLHKKCVCEGYAETLRNALALKGIECRYVRGENIKTSSNHAWNQVKIGGKWFNVDLTWAIEWIPDAIRNNKPIGKTLLQTDEEFRDHSGYRIVNPKGVEKCDTPLEDILRDMDKENEEDVEF